ncbi:MAG: CheR family methyltransferase, partial [Pseudomonadota bacterium]
YLVQHGDGVRVTDMLRSAVLFSDHNVCQDPPFQKVDLLCCRNLLIYFGHALQKKVMSRFHYSMSPEALLFLGTAESVAGSDELFVADSPGTHVYRKRTIAQSVGSYQMPNIPSMSTTTARQSPATRNREAETSTDRQFFDALMMALGENSILVDEDCTILRVNGSISQFVEVTAQSKLKMHIDLLRSPLREEARSLVTIALKNKTFRQGIRHEFDESSGKAVQLGVYPIVAPRVNERAGLIVFNTIDSPPARPTVDGSELDLSAASAERISDLENEVAVTREALQQTIEELETSNEELQALNEELQSTNEELQATNEELETSNEELQSTNEELITVNEELQITTSELSGRTGELTSVLQSAPLPIIVTDSALQITQMTAAASDLFQIRTPQQTPHVSQANLPEGYPALAPICSEALRLGQTTTHEFNSKGDQVILTCTPYFDEHGKILGLTMVVTILPNVAAEAAELKMLLEMKRIFLMNRTIDGKVLRISNTSAAALGRTTEDVLGKNISDIMPKELAEREAAIDRDLLNGKLEKGEAIFIVKDQTEDRDRVLALERHVYKHPSTGEDTIYNVGTDLTGFIDVVDQTLSAVSRIRKLSEQAGLGYWELDTQEQTVYWTDKVFDIHGLDKGDYHPNVDSALAYYHPDDVERVRSVVEQVATPGGEFRFQARLLRADGETVMVESTGVAVSNYLGEVIKVIGSFTIVGDG